MNVHFVRYNLGLLHHSALPATLGNFAGRDVAIGALDQRRCGHFESEFGDGRKERRTVKDQTRPANRRRLESNKANSYQKFRRQHFLFCLGRVDDDRRDWQRVCLPSDRRTCFYTAQTSRVTLAFFVSIQWLSAFRLCAVLLTCLSCTNVRVGFFRVDNF